MPVAILCGFPYSGKASIAERLALLARSQVGIEVVIVSLETIKRTPRRVFSSTSETRNTHTLLRAEVTKHLSTGKFVILDFYNYIRGFRYEVYCAAKEQGTTSCCIWCNASAEECWGRNDTPEYPRYDLDLFYDIATRFEIPSPAARWDLPLFTVSGIRDPSVTRGDLMTRIIEALMSPKKLKPLKSTKPPVYRSGDSMVALSEATLNVVKLIAEALGSGGYAPGEILVTPHFRFSIPFCIGELAPVKLHDLRRRFMKLREDVESDPEKVEQDFCNFITATLKKKM